MCTSIILLKLKRLIRWKQVVCVCLVLMRNAGGINNMLSY